MSKNFELLRSIQKQPEILAPVGNGSDHFDRIRHLTSQGTVSGDNDWLRIVAIFQRQWRRSAALAVVVFIAVAVFTATIKPVYEPQARIEVDPPGAEAFSLQGAGSTSDESQYLETQAKELRSDDLAMAVIHKLNLDQHPQSADSRSGENQPKPQDESASEPQKESAALRWFRRNLDVSRDSASRLITISLSANDPRLAAEITNTLVNLFINGSYLSRHTEVVKSSEWLAKQLDDVREKMQESNKALARFQAATGIANLDANGSTFTEKMTELNRQLAQAQAERIQHQALLDQLQRGGETDMSQLNADAVIQELRKRLSESRAELSRALVIYGKENPNAKNLQGEINELEKQIVVQRNRIVEDEKTSYLTAQTREHLLSQQIRDASQELNKVAQYEALKKEAQANAELYNTLFAKIKEAGIAAESTSSNIRVIDWARVLSSPTRPNRLLNLGAGLLAGLIAGVALAFGNDALDRTVRTPRDLKECTGLAAVTIVPVIAPAHGGLLSARRQFTPKVMLDRPNSPESEALLGLYTSLRFSSAGCPPKTILIASPSVGDGKTTVAINLAIALAREGRTCLVEADMRKTVGIEASFAVSSDWGLREVLAESVVLEKALTPVPDLPNLFVLVAGSGHYNPTDLLYSETLAKVMRDLRSGFEHIVVDSPPMLPFAEARALARVVDGIVLVGRAGYTSKEALVRSIELLEESNSAPVLKVVLNAAGAGSLYYDNYR